MSALFAWLVVLGACVATLEIQRHLLLARVLGALLMLLTWGCLLPPKLQLKAACCAVVYHGMAEGLRQWQRSFPCVFDDNKHQKLVLWLLFWARIFIWGATLGGVALAASVSRDVQATCSPWKQAALLAVYYEVVEVLVMFYYADREMPYIWKKRVGHWIGELLVGFLESSGRLDVLLKSWWLAGMSPLALVGVLLMAMWLSIEIPWHQIAEVTAPRVEEDDDKDRELRFADYRARPELFVDTGRRGNGDFYRS